MCGIAGKVDWGGTVRSEVVTKMCDKMRHRGPDDHDVVSLGNIALGHRRLSIIDLSRRARQPMASDDKRYFIVYNGEVYNFNELKRELVDIGVNFSTSSDTEVVLYSYIKWGPECLNRFNGMFAFAIWDNEKKELFLARDRFGKKPLYYYKSRNKMTFASELGALICDDDVPREISYEALNSYLALGYILSPMTLYKDVFKLEPATHMTISYPGERMYKTQYWDYADRFRVKMSASEKDIAVNLLTLLNEAVKKRMVSDVPIGAFLSGGVDSSSISSIMKKYHREELHTFSIGFDQKSYNEIDAAERVAKWIGTTHHNKICRIDDNRGLIDEALGAHDEPFADNSLIPTFALAKLTSSYVKVALSGDGADEIFAGYMTYKADRCYFYAQALPLFIRNWLVGSKLRGNPKRQTKLDLRYKKKQFFYGSLHSAEKAHYLWRIMLHPEERIGVLGEDKRELVYDTDPFSTFKKYYDRVKDIHWLDKNLYVDAMTWLADDIMVKVDRASMRNSIEVRNPYLDVDLVSYAASIPAEIKMKGLRTKYILKKSLKGVLPDFVLNKKKSGFNAPIRAWFGSDSVDEFKIFNKYVFDKKVKL